MCHVIDILTLAAFSKQDVVSSLGFEWKPVSDGSIPAYAVLAGHDTDGGPIYVGRALFRSDLLPAKVVRNHRAAYVSFGGIEHRVTSYEVKTTTAFHTETQHYFAFGMFLAYMLAGRLS
jgi:hypothetical protein